MDNGEATGSHVVIDYNDSEDPPIIGKILAGFGIVYVVGLVYAVSVSVI